MPCLKQDFFFFCVCVCCEGTRGKVLQKSKTSAAGVSLSWVVGVCSLGVNLSHPASEVTGLVRVRFLVTRIKIVMQMVPGKMLPVWFGRMQRFSPLGGLLRSIWEAEGKALTFKRCGGFL